MDFTFLNDILRECITTNKDIKEEDREKETTFLKEIIIAFSVPTLNEDFSPEYPIKIKDLIHDKLTRNINHIKELLTEIEDNNSILNKKDLLENIIKKYGLDTLSTNPVAYHSEPEHNAPDKDLHQYFLQPFLLAISDPNKRKYIGSNAISAEREWLLYGDNNDTDIAPLLRKIIQYYLIENINEMFENELPNDFNTTEKLEQLQEKLKEESSRLFKETYKAHRRQKSPGFFSFFSSIAQTTEEYFNNTLRIAARDIAGAVNDQFKISNFFVLGRLLFGQPRENSTYNQMVKNNTFFAPIFSFTLLRGYLIIFLLTLRVQVYTLKDTLKSFSQSPFFSFATLGKIKSASISIRKIGLNCIISFLVALGLTCNIILTILSIPFLLLRKFNTNRKAVLIILDILELAANVLSCLYILTPFLSISFNPFIQVFSIPFLPQVTLAFFALHIIKSLLNKKYFFTNLCIAAIEIWLFTFSPFFKRLMIALFTPFIAIGFAVAGACAASFYFAVNLIKHLFSRKINTVLIPNPTGEKISIHFIIDEKLGNLKTKAENIISKRLLRYRNILQSLRGKANSKTELVKEIFFKIFKFEENNPDTFSIVTLTNTQDKLDDLAKRLAPEKLPENLETARNYLIETIKDTENMLTKVKEPDNITEEEIANLYSPT